MRTYTVWCFHLKIKRGVRWVTSDGGVSPRSADALGHTWKLRCGGAKTWGQTEFSPIISRCHCDSSAQPRCSGSEMISSWGELGREKDGKISLWGSWRWSSTSTCCSHSTEFTSQRWSKNIHFYLTPQRKSPICDQINTNILWRIFTNTFCSDEKNVDD